jgi:hypothetical protein
MSSAAPTIARGSIRRYFSKWGSRTHDARRLTKLNRDRGSAGAHDNARDPLSVCRRREQDGRGSHVRPDDVRSAKVDLDNELGKEVAHRSR